MYCSSCGVAVVQGLSYCNYCGEKLGGAKDESVAKSSEVRPEKLVQLMATVFVFGLLAITVLLGVMKAILRLDIGVILGFAALSFLIMLVIEGVLIRLLMRRKHAAYVASDNVLSNELATKELDAAHAGVLQEPVPSVTEHTTRAFAPVQNKRR